MCNLIDLRGIGEEFLYAETQCNDEIKDGDVLLCDNGIALMVEAWPVSISNNMFDFHVLANHLTWETFEDGKYLESYKLAIAQNFGGDCDD